jgi:hypothetical protein
MVGRGFRNAIAVSWPVAACRVGTSIERENKLSVRDADVKWKAIPEGFGCAPDTAVPHQFTSINAAGKD